MTEKFYDVPGAARVLGLKHETMRRWLRSGKVRGLRLGRDWRIPERALNELAHSTTNQPNKNPSPSANDELQTEQESTSKAERLAALSKLRELAAGTRAGLPPIPDEALSIENLYAGRGE